MSDSKEKKFSICHVFNKLSSLNIWEDWHGDVMERFGSKWIIRLLKNGCGDISPDLLCENSETVDWSINTKFDVIVNGKLFETGLQFEFTKNNMETGVSYIRKIDFIKFEIEESVKIEFRVKITEMTGIEEKKSRSFDDDVAKESSDVVLMVGDQKFYVAKLLLTFHSTYFKCLFSGSFSESQKSEIELKDIDPLVFQYFLELIYGISLLNDTIIMDILELADFFDAQIVMERCEEFLLNRSEKPVAVKFQAALKYKMEKLKVKCYSEIKKGTDFHGVSPQNEEDFSKKDWKELFDKVVSFF
ncbi:hypothetical protein B9Z55_007928 [Caenorhabditis nigoni]|uniref:BTB domain-containing protein n=1 Tax=Caenorhabditis nigoni TaxID=1611254 RepID=A0A2G5VBY2_9PELO|nr:hypothetical protein B9Z55_007928 [Caenorhabditis nigoni]